MTSNKTGKGPKIVKMEKPETIKIELTPEQLKIKEKFIEIDEKVKSLEDVLSTIVDENQESVFSEEVMGNIIGLSAIAAASNIVSEYFGLENVNLSDLF